MTLDAFRADGALVKEWRAVLDMPITRLVLSIMAQEAPVHRVVKSDISPTYAAVKLGHQAGWAEYDKTLTEVVLIPPQSTEQLEHTYENPAEEKKE